MNKELKNKLQPIINHKEQQLNNLMLNYVIQQAEEIITLKQLRDFAEDEEMLLFCLGWLSISRKQPQPTRVIKENLTETIQKEISLIEKNNLLTQQLTNEELLQEIRKRVHRGEIDWNEVVNFPPHE